MRYVGSKNRISKELAPIIQSHVDKGVVGYLEPFVGGETMCWQCTGAKTGILCEMCEENEVDPYEN